MNFAARIVLFCLLFSLAGCVSNSFRQQELAQCKATCARHFEFCKKNCINNCPVCFWQSTQNTVQNFTKYTMERKVEGKKVMRELNSYRDPLQCRKITCNCMMDLMTCNQSCSGVIRKRLQVIPNCV